MDAYANSQICLPFTNNTNLELAYHVHVELKEIHGIQLKSFITEWDIGEFLKKEFSESIYNLTIQYEYYYIFSLSIVMKFASIFILIYKTLSKS